MDSVRAKTNAPSDAAATQPAAAVGAPRPTQGRTVTHAAALSFAPRKAKDEEPEPPPQIDVVGDEQPDGDEATPQRNTDPANTKFERARRALLREGVMKDDEIRKLDRRDAIRRGLKLERAQNHRAAEFARLKAEAQKTDQGSTGASSGATQSRVATPSDDAWLVDLFAKLDITDDPAAQATLKAQLSPVLAERAQLRAENSERSRANGSDVDQAKRLERVRVELTKSISELGDDDDFLNHVGPAMQVLERLPRFAKASTDDNVLRELMVAAAHMALEEVGERDEPAPAQRAPGMGFVDVTGSARTRDAVVPDEKAAFMARVHRSLDRFARTG
jgi:hypothetical protein